MDSVRQVQEKFSLLDQVPLGSCILRSDYTVLFWNLCLEEWTKIPRKKILGTSILQHFPHLSQGQYADRLSQIFQGGPPTIFSSQLHKYIIPILNSKGKHRIQHTTVTAVPAVEGNGFYAFFSIQDVTDLTFQVQEYRGLRDQAVSQAQEYQRAQEVAETANRIKDEFLAIVSHELRSPLNPILGWAKLLRQKSWNEATTQRALETIERNAELQAQLIDDLLDISRILRGKLSLNLEVVDLGTVIAAALETVRLAAEAKSIEIRLNLQTPVAQVRGDAGRLQQVFWNLLSNAIKFTPYGGWIDLTLERIDTKLQLQIRDSGEGINPQFLPYVFEYFRQADSSTTRKSGGLGLGLAIVRQLVELHGGRVWAESLGEGQGATFIVHLPLFQAPPNGSVSLQNPSVSVPYPEPHAALEGIRILVVDDDVDNCEFMVFLLEQQGAIVTSAKSAGEALATIHQSQPDILLSDLGMPEVDGYALIRQLRQLPKDQGGQIPAIALTAYAAETTQQQVFAAGFQRHIAKPADPLKLISAIAGLANNKTLLR